MHICRHNLYERVRNLMKKLKEDDPPKIQFNAVFLPSPYKRHRKTYNKQCNVTDLSDFADMSGGILDSQQSLAMFDVSPKRSPSPLAEADLAEAISPTVTSSLSPASDSFVHYTERTPSPSPNPYSPLTRAVASIESALTCLSECEDRLAYTTKGLLRVHPDPKPNPKLSAVNLMLYPTPCSNRKCRHHWSARSIG